MTKDEGIIITNSLPTKKADNFARKNKIIIINKITNEKDLIEKLKYIFRKNGE